MKKLNYLYLALVGILCWSCGDSTQAWVEEYRVVRIYNHETEDLEIWVDGEHAITAEPEGYTRVMLLAGSYSFEARLAGSGEVLSKTEISLPGETDDNKFDKFIFNYQERAYALVNCNAYYYDDEEIEVDDSYFNQSFIHAESEDWTIYMHHTVLPYQITDGQDVYKLIEIPAELEGDDAGILEYARYSVMEDEG